MKWKTLFFVLFVSCLNIAGVQSETYKTYGAEAKLSADPVSLSAAVDNMQKDAMVRVRGKVTSVCQRKGCWMMLTDGKLSARTTFKDYGFFVPTDVSGKEVIVEGTLAETIISQEEARHYAKDAGKTAEQVESIQGDQKGYAIVAVSVQIPQ